MVNFRVVDLDAMLAQLRSGGVEVIDALEESEYGRFGWAVDPEGTRFEIWEPPPGRRGATGGPLATTSQPAVDRRNGHGGLVAAGGCRFQARKRERSTGHS
jgi:hypothetical protein